MRSVPRALTVLAVAALGVQPLAADDGWCGLKLTERDVPIIRLLEAQRPPFAPPEQVYTVGLTFHVVRTSAGTGGIPQWQLDQAVKDANFFYAPAGMSYCVVGPIDYIDDDLFYILDKPWKVDALRQINVVPDTVNVYFVADAGFCGLSSFTFSPVQGIIMVNGCTALPGMTHVFPHELGHYFNLFHTHETFLGVECTNGSNCAIAGDLLCDTAADPNVFGKVNALCQWTGQAPPPCGGQPYNPPTRNIMSYSTGACSDEFTPKQYERALATLVLERTELNLELCGGACPPDFNGDGALNIDDFIAFQLAFALKDPKADFNKDGKFDIDDFIAFQLAFALGC